MAQTQQPTTAEFVGNIAEFLADRKEYLQQEYARTKAEKNEGLVLLANLKKYINVLGSLPACSEFATEYIKYCQEATDRETALLQQLEKLAERQQTIKTEHNILNSLQYKKGDDIK